MQNKQTFLLHSKVPFIIKDDELHRKNNSQLLKSLEEIGCLCHISGPTQKEFLTADPYAFHASFKGLFLNENKKEHMSGYVVHGTSILSTFHSFMSGVREKLGSGILVAPKIKPVDFEKIEWFIFDKEHQCFIKKR